MIKIILWIVGIVCALGILTFASIFINMVFISNISTSKLSMSKLFKPLVSFIQIKEISGDNEPVLEFNYRPDSGDTESGQDVVVYEDKTKKLGERAFDEDPGVGALTLEAPSNDGAPLLFLKGDVYTYKNLKLGEKLASLDNPKIEYVTHVVGAGNQFFLAEARLEVPRGAPIESYLFQVSRSDFSMTLLTKDPYFGFVRPPKVFKPEGFNGVIAVYYVDSWDFGFGGDSSRPKWSVVRMFIENYSSGIDIAKFGFRAGTIVDVKFENGKIILRGDPSLPSAANKDPVPSKVWEISFSEDQK